VSAELRNFDTEIERLDYASTGRLMAADVFDGTAFEALLAYLASKGDQIADDFVVSKQVLASARNAEAAIRSRSEYLPDARSGLPLAAKFATLLDLIILGERPGERVPGKPRAF
jgi:hypothetical protein